MALTDEQIRKIMQKEIKSKTLLADASKVEEIKKEYLDDGWKLVSEVEVNGRYKLTFTKIK